jgi:hypothetical protein
LGAIWVQPETHSMENTDWLDKLTPIYGDTMDYIPPYVGDGHPGRLKLINRTEEVAGSNPARSTGKRLAQDWVIYQV